jgi:hypothetical protein
MLVDQPRELPNIVYNNHFSADTSARKQTKRSDFPFTTRAVYKNGKGRHSQARNTPKTNTPGISLLKSTIHYS